MLDKIFTHAEDIVWQVDLNLELVYLSDNISASLGYTPQTCLGKPMSDFFQPRFAQRVNNVFTELRSERKFNRYFLMPIINADNKQVLFETSVFGIYDEQNKLTHFAGIARLARRYLRKRKQLIENKRLLSQTLKSRNQFFSVVSHEMRNHLNIINGLSYFLLESAKHHALEQQEAIASMHFSAAHLSVLVNDILDLERIRKNTLKLQKQVFSLGDLLHRITQAFRLQAESKSLHLRLMQDADLPEKVEGDPTRLNQILSNLLSNAIKFTPEGKVDLIVSIESDTQADDKLHILFEVRDTGIGILEEEIESVMSPFQQANAMIQENFGGSGLGLYIVQNLVNLYGGKLKLDSVPNQGTSFRVTLPFRKVQQQVANTLTLIDSEETIINWQDFKVLYVEDVRFNQFLAEKLFIRWQIPLDLADNAEIAIGKLQERHYDLILMDIRMPGMNGYELSRLIRQDQSLRHQETPIVALSGSDLSINMEKVQQAGMNDVLRKPFQPQDLHNLLQFYAKPQEKDLPHNLDVEHQVETKLNLVFFEELFADSPKELQEVVESARQDLIHFAGKMQTAILERNFHKIADIRHRLKPLLINLNQEIAILYFSSLTNLDTLTPKQIEATAELCYRYLTRLADKLVLPRTDLTTPKS